MIQQRVRKIKSWITKNNRERNILKTSFYCGMSDFLIISRRLVIGSYCNKMKNIRLKRSHIISLIILVVFMSCKRGDMKSINNKFPKLQEIPQEKWQKLAKKKIFFGHQSVGNNIIAGLNDIMEYMPNINLNIINTTNLTDFSNPIFAHSNVGVNGNPISKCDDFTRIMESGISDKVDIAFFKFCYVDIKQKSNVEEVFKAYKESMNKLANKYPNTIFVHVTTPLRVCQSGPKALVKKLIKKPLYGFLDNIKRNQFNTMLRKEYKGKTPIFDLALIESTYPDGKRKKNKQGGKICYSLIREYTDTDDGGHLNKYGRVMAAEKLLTLLAKL